MKRLGHGVPKLHRGLTAVDEASSPTDEREPYPELVMLLPDIRRLVNLGPTASFATLFAYG